MDLYVQERGKSAEKMVNVLSSGLPKVNTETMTQVQVETGEVMPGGTNEGRENTRIRETAVLTAC